MGIARNWLWVTIALAAAGCGDDDDRGKEDSSADGAAQIDAGASDSGRDATDGRVGPMHDGAAAASDASADSASPSSDASTVRFRCRTAGAATAEAGAQLLFATAPGRTFAVGGTSVLTMTRSIPREGWALWSLTSGDLVASSGSDLMDIDEGVIAAGVDSFLVRNQNGARDFRWRSMDSGQQIAAFGHPIPHEFPPSGGIASDGSYAFVYDSVLTAVARDGTAWLVDSDDSFFTSGFYAAPEALYAAGGDTTTTTVRRFPRDGSEATIIGPVAGAFVDWFEDGTHFVTRGAAGFLRVFSRDGMRVSSLQDERYAEGTLYRFRDDDEVRAAVLRAGGRGNTFWVQGPKGAEPGLRLQIFNLTESPQELHAVDLQGRGERTDVGVAAPITQATWQHVTLTGSTPSVQTFEHRVLDAAIVTRATVRAEHRVVSWQVQSGATKSEFAQIDDSQNLLGCGTISASAANGQRFVVSTTLGGTFVYDAGLDTPVATVARSASLVLMPRTGERFALQTGVKTVTVYDASANPVFTYEAPVEASLSTPQPVFSLSPDGTLLGVSYYTPEGNSPGLLHWRAFRVADGAMLFSVDLEGSTPSPLLISPNNKGFVAGVRIYQGVQLLGTFEGIVDWVDDTRLHTAMQIISNEGLPLGGFACPPTLARQWTSPTEYYAQGNICDVSTGAPLATSKEPAPPNLPPFGAWSGTELYHFANWRVFSAAYSFFKMPARI